MPMTFTLDQWSIVPGPRRIRPPFDSTHLDEIEEYSPQLVADATLALPGARLIQPAHPDWCSWLARCSTDDGYIDLRMTLFDTDPIRWGGFRLAGRASPESLLELYTHLHLALPAAWLHNTDCELHTAESFGAKVRAA